METKDILITGARGHLGCYLSSESTFDYIGSLDSLTTDVLSQLKPKVIVNCAAKTDMIWCESNREECFYNNVKAPVALFKRVRHVLGQTAVFIQISSGCIWDGPFTKYGWPFSPNVFAEPQCVYTESKVACERALFEEKYKEINVPGLVVLRPRLIFSDSHSSRNLLCKLLKYENLIDDYNSFTSCETIKKAVGWYVLDAKSGQSCSTIAKTHNIYDIGVSTPYSIAVKLHMAGLRTMPKKLDKSGLDAWHKPKRVNVIMQDEEFESKINPNYLEITLDKCIKSLAVKLQGE